MPPPWALPILAEWERYFTDKDRNTLLNVISLEFSKTRLDPLVQSPAVVRRSVMKGLFGARNVWPFFTYLFPLHRCAPLIGSTMYGQRLSKHSKQTPPTGQTP